TISTTSIPVQLGGSPYLWSADNSAEVALGWVIKGATSPADLAKAINSATIASVPAGGAPNTLASNMVFNMDPNVLTTTINTFNGYCTSGVDLDFGRAKSTLTALQTPPYYAIPVWPVQQPHPSVV